MTDGVSDHLGDAREWALGILPEDRAVAFLAHLETCDPCQAEVERSNATLAALIDAVPRDAPSADLRTQLMAAVGEEAALSRAADDVTDRTSRGDRRRLRPLALVAAVAATAAIAGAFAGSRVPKDPTNRTISGRVTDAGGGRRAQAQIRQRGSIAQLRLSDVSAPPRGRVYQVWLLAEDGRAKPTGSLFSVPRTGNTIVAIPSLRDVEKVIVTAEPKRGSSKPTLPAVAVVAIPH